jgi:hypothetical protein
MMHVFNQILNLKRDSRLNNNNNAEGQQQSSNSAGSKLKTYKKYYVTCSFGRIMKAYMKKNENNVIERSFLDLVLDLQHANPELKLTDQDVLYEITSLYIAVS